MTLDPTRTITDLQHFRCGHQLYRDGVLFGTAYHWQKHGDVAGVSVLLVPELRTAVVLPDDTVYTVDHVFVPESAYGEYVIYAGK